MEQTVRQRINDILSNYKMSMNKLSGGNSALQVKLSRQLSQGSQITCQTIMFILDSFPNVSAEWLLRGEGDMIKTEKTVSNYNIKGTDNSVSIGGDSQGDITTNASDKDIMMKLLEQNQQLISMLGKK